MLASAAVRSLSSLCARSGGRHPASAAGEGLLHHAPGWSRLVPAGVVISYTIRPDYSILFLDDYKGGLSAVTKSILKYY